MRATVFILSRNIALMCKPLHLQQGTEKKKKKNIILGQVSTEAQKQQLEKKTVGTEMITI